MLAIVDYGVGNLFSLACSLRHIGQACEVTGEKERLAQADGILLPGVGAFGDAIHKLRENGLDQTVYTLAKAGKPLLGICLGFQLLYEASAEYGLNAGLGLLHGQVVSLEKAAEKGTKVPHMGWNSLQFKRDDCPLLRYIHDGDFVYYVHSFYAVETPETVAVSSYGGVCVTGAAQAGNVFGTQFHPEKSGATGLAILRAFAELCAEQKKS
jgi:glutamine amidotransferase